MRINYLNLLAKRMWLATWALLSFCLQLHAQDHLVLHFDFSSVNGSSVQDASEGGITGKLMNGAKVEEMGKYRVLNLATAGGYLDMTAKAGMVVQGLKDYSVSVYYRTSPSVSISGNGYFLWSFSSSEANTATASPYSGYRVNAQRFATSTGGWQNETGIETGTASATGKWMHVVYRQSSKKGELYINGSLVGTATGMPEYATIFTAAPAYNWIGRPPFSGDIYLTNTLVADFRVYDVCIDDAELRGLADRVEDLEYAFNYGTPGDPSALQKKVTEVENAMMQLDGSYPQGAIDNVKDALNIAKTMIEAGRASQTLLDNAQASLQAAYSSLSAKKGFTMWAVSSYDMNEDRGFIHPGGLHTQADFDRIKQQLANGNEKVTAAYNVLKNAEYAQPSVQTYPTEIVVRGGSGENYMNAARGAAMAYQNALRWKIEGSEACAKAAVRILMQWARTTKGVGGDSNYALAVGLYGYQFAQAAELMRDYNGWSPADFATFKEWMLRVWCYPAIGFLRRRNNTWENAGKWWQAPGTYWSNWGLCNALCVISVGILCDDVFIYNQGMSYFKYDQCGTFRDPRTEVPIKNDGLAEFLGNFVVTTYESELETGAYGLLGQLNESGRDAGHSSMSLGVALDVAKVGWNQGDDLFSYMNHRLAAGIEYLAAQSLSVEGLPWVNYQRADNGIYYTDSRSWVMTGPAMGAQMRPYWGTVIGIYESVKGVKMPFAEQAYENMGIDGGGQGSTSGGYDHLGYSVLMNTHDVQLAPAETVATELSPKMEYSGTLNTNLIPSLSVERTLGNVSGKTIAHSELGGLVNTYRANLNTCVPRGETLTLMPQLPEGEEDTGLWQWNTGETSRNITVQTDHSRIYRVTYTNAYGVESQQAFSIAATGDCIPAELDASITYNGETVQDTVVTVMYGESVQLHLGGIDGYGDYRWDTGETGTGTITVSNLAGDRIVTGQYMNQGGNVQERRFHIHVVKARQLYSINNGTEQEGATLIAPAGSSVKLTLYIPTSLDGGEYTWMNAAGDTLDCTSASLTVDSVSTSVAFTACYPGGVNAAFQVYVREATDRMVDIGNYRIHHRATDTYLTNNGDSVGFEPSNGGLNQVWFIERTEKQARYNLCSMVDSMLMKTDGGLFKVKTRPHRIAFAAGTDYCAFYNSKDQYWYLDENGKLILCEKTVLDDFPFELIPAQAIKGDLDGDGIITANDITLLIDLYLNYTDTIQKPEADLDEDGEITVEDITQLINIYLDMR